MKKVFLKVFTCLAIGAFGVLSTSCDDDTISAIINVVTNLIGQQGETYQYSSNGKVQMLYSNDGGQSFTMKQAEQDFRASIAVQVNGQSATVTIPSMTVDGLTTSNLTISGLVLEAGQSYTTLKMSEAGVNVDGTITLGDSTCSITNLFVDDVRLTSEEMTMKMFQVYFGNSSHVLSLTNVQGKVAAQQ